MTEEQLIQRARQIAAGIRDSEGHEPAFAQFMREGAYDNTADVLIAIAALRFGYAEASRKAKTSGLAA